MINNLNLFSYDSLSLFIALFIAIFTILVLIYSIGFMKGYQGIYKYYIYIILTFCVSLGVVFSNNLILLIVCWGMLAIFLYLLIIFGKKERAITTAKKTFIIIGGTDAVMLLGLGLVWMLTGSVNIDEISIPLHSKAAVMAYLCLAIGAFAKAGAMPFHPWVPDTAEDAPIPVTAYLPASLDKLLGIYLLARISLDMFQMNSAMNIVLMAVGSFTIIAAVMMALVQHDMKRLLGYHAVSQVGYMVLGIGTGNPIGIAGGLFHMLNHAIYKSCLFFSGGSVEKKTGTTDLSLLGGLGKVMPVTFITFLIASLSISGVPPFNGFASKWMVYQGIINTAKENSFLWIIWLAAAMFGSALTLASFMKLIHAIFLGQPAPERNPQSDARSEVNFFMWMPQVFLALLCVIFGVWAYQIPLSKFIFPSLSTPVEFTGVWNASLATVFILMGIGMGFIMYLVGARLPVRETEIFVGGEDVKKFPDMRISGTEFYHTIKDIPVFRVLYMLAERKVFDIYEVGVKITFGFNAVLRYLHNGILPTYLSWCLLATLILFYFLLR